MATREQVTPQIEAQQERQPLKDAQQRRLTLPSHPVTQTKAKAFVDSLLASVRKDGVNAVSIPSIETLCPLGLTQALRLLVSLLEDGVDVVLEKGTDGRTIRLSESRWILSSLWHVACEHRSRRMRTAINEARKRGVRLGRPPVQVDREEVLKLRAKGLSLREIGRRLGVSKSKVWSVLHGE